MPTIAITSVIESLFPKAQELAALLKLPVVQYPSTDYDFLLIYTPFRLEIKETAAKTNPIYVDFLNGKAAYRQSHGGGYKQLIAKAVGIKKNHNITLLDATAGLAQDAFVLAGLGCKVLLIERSPIIAALLIDGLNRAQNLFNANNIEMSLISLDAIKYLQQIKPNDYPEVIYLDPMYPQQAKTALAKKELRIIRQIVGDDLDADQLLAIALTVATKRVVVKRPRLAVNSAKFKPDIVFSGKSCRFDVYLCKTK